MDVMQTIEEYTRHLHIVGYSKATIECYGRYLELFKARLLKIGITDIRMVTRQTILDYQAKVMEESIAVESRALKLRPVKRLFEHLTANNRLLIDPASGIVETCRKNRQIGYVLTQKQMRDLLSRPDLSTPLGIRDKAVMEFLYSTGIRVNELIHLKTHHLDLENRVAIVRKGKGGTQRAVPFGKTAAKYVGLYLEKARPGFVQKNVESAGNPDLALEPALFLNRFGRPLTRLTIQAFIRRSRIEAGIPHPVSPHTFRRTCATHMLQNKADIRYVQKLLGHARLSTTRLYTRVLCAELKQTHEKTHPGTGGADDD